MAKSLWRVEYSNEFGAHTVVDFEWRVDAIALYDRRVSELARKGRRLDINGKYGTASMGFVRATGTPCLAVVRVSEGLTCRYCGEFVTTQMGAWYDDHVVCDICQLAFIS